MTPAEHARNAAISMEVKKDALRQTQDGTWKITFTVQCIDMDERITRAPMGTRFVAVLVEVGSDEMPVHTPAKETVPTPGQNAPKPDRVKQSPKRDWRDIPFSQQAGIHCADPIFAAFLRENYPNEWKEAPETADCVRLICAVESRSELNDGPSRVIWFQLDSQFQGWRALERA